MVFTVFEKENGSQLLQKKINFETRLNDNVLQRIYGVYYGVLHCLTLFGSQKSQITEIKELTVTVTVLFDGVVLQDVFLPVFSWITMCMFNWRMPHQLYL